MNQEVILLSRKELRTNVLRQKFLYFDCHYGLDPESSIFELDSRFWGNDGFGTNVKKRWTHYTKPLGSLNPLIYRLGGLPCLLLQSVDPFSQNLSHLQISLLEEFLSILMGSLFPFFQRLPNREKRTSDCFPSPFTSIS